MDDKDGAAVNVADALRDLSSVREPDPRSPLPPRPGTGGVVCGGLENHLTAIQRYVLCPEVPIEIRTHFETARNLYLYAWFVYRFYMVADHYVYLTLELALRTRLHPKLRDENRGPGLKALLKEALKTELLTNRKFSSVQRHAAQRAHERQSRELIRQMEAEGLPSIEVPKDVELIDEDYAFDALGIWVEAIPDLRNMHAHGTTSLWPTVLGTFEIVSELINQLYEPPDKL